MEEEIHCRDEIADEKRDVDCEDRAYVIENAKCRKDKCHKVGDETEDSTESEIGEINTCMTEYMDGPFIDHMTRKADEIKEKGYAKPKAKERYVLARQGSNQILNFTPPNPLPLRFRWYCLRWWSSTRR